MKNLNKIIIILIICIVIIIFVIFGILKMQPKEDNYDNNISADSYYQEEIIDKKFKKIDNHNIFFSVRNILSDYVRYFENINGDTDIEIGRIQMSEEQIRSEYKKEALKAILVTLDKEYNENFNIKEENVIKLTAKYKNNNTTSKYSIDIQEMYVADINRGKNLVLTYTKINNVEFVFMLKLDYNNNTYSVFLDNYLEKNGYTKDRTNPIDISDNDIEKNDYNKFIDVAVTPEYKVMYYFDDYKEKMKNNPKAIYQILDEKYREKRFQSYDDFTRYLSYKNGRLQNLEIVKYKIDNNQINILDNNNNIYIIDVSDIINYKIQLDDYTIDSDEFIAKYDKSSEEVKVGMNIVKVFEAINGFDYGYVYNKLDETFKKNNYDTIEKFIKYMKENLYENNEVEYIKCSKEQNTYIYQIKVTDSKEESSLEKNMTIIMQLLEDRDFVMSFSIE